VVRLEARELVPGDVIRLRMGDIVPADARLLVADPIEVDSIYIDWRITTRNRQVGEAVLSGSIIRQARMEAWFMPRALTTYFGKTQS